jgi:IS4 transposase
LDESVFRVILFRTEGKNEDTVLITDILNLRAEMIAAMYRRRWDIEVFFRFIRQELNFSHFISMNTDGIQITLYMTLTVAMLLMIYRQANGTGFRTAKRRMKIELQELIIAIAVVRSGGDLSKLNLPPP